MISLADRKFPPMEDLRDLFYYRLIREYGFVHTTQFRVPKTKSGVVRSEIEVVAMATTRKEALRKGLGRAGVGVLVEVRVPVPLPTNLVFRSRQCCGIRFLSQKQRLIIRTAEDVAHSLPFISALTRKGIYLIDLYRADLLPVITYKNQR